jgi:hypothetical protein
MAKAAAELKAYEKKIADQAAEVKKEHEQAIKEQEAAYKANAEA